MNVIIENIFEKVRRSVFFNKILKLIGALGLDKVCIRLMYKWFERHPTEKMRKSVEYFKIHEDDIVRIEEYLADDKSKRIWRQMIEFRQTMNYKHHPGMECDQYFVKDIVKMSEQEIFIDCGGYDGLTSLDFIGRVHGKYEKIIIFEPDNKCYSRIQKNMPNDKRIQVIPKGVWDREDALSFVASGDAASHIAEEGVAGAETISVVSIDKCDECRNASFIKMDLEGAEQKALRGAEHTIKRNMPKLAICIYHSDEDMLKIIDYIHNLVPEYKLYVRHHSTAAIETVVYAIR